MLAAAPPLPEGWAVVEGDATALPYSDHSFDVVTICYLLHLLEPQGRLCVLREARRVAGPQGRVVIVTVDARSLPLRWVLKLPPRWTGLRTIDLAGDLRTAKLRAVRSLQVGGGWPSSCWLAEPAG
jgi:ubiquinone/menaquinone biosynthesis C-methylase UbiE